MKATMFTKGLCLSLAVAFSIQAKAAVFDQELYTIPSPKGSAKLICAKESSGMIYVGQNNIVYRRSTASGVQQVEVAKIRNLYFEKSGLQAQMVLDIGEDQPLVFKLLGVAGENSNIISYHTELDWTSDHAVTNAGKLIQSGFDSCSFEVLK
jgi:hypothetical protein